MTSIDIYAHPHYNTFKSFSHEDLLIDYIEFCATYTETPKSSLTEGHHIFPKSIFGDNDVIINLPIREHFNAHVMLWKLIDPNKHLRHYKRMANAVHKMVQGRDGFTADEYEIARIAIKCARVNTVTTYDLRTGNYIKLLRDLIDFKRYFPTKLMLHTPTNKITFISVMDPRWIDCVSAGSHQQYIDHETGDVVTILTSVAAQHPERYEIFHKRIGHTPSKSRARKYYDVDTETYINCSPAVAKENGYVGCSNYLDTFNNNKIVYIASPAAKKEPWRYIHANKGRVDVLVKATGEAVKIPKADYDPELHEFLQISKCKKMKARKLSLQET